MNLFKATSKLLVSYREPYRSDILDILFKVDRLSITESVPYLSQNLPRRYKCLKSRLAAMIRAQTGLKVRTCTNRGTKTTIAATSGG